MPNCEGCLDKFITEVLLSPVTQSNDLSCCRQEEDEEAFKKQFSRYIKLGITADSIESMYKKAHAAIRADPAAKPKPPKKEGGVQKRWTAKKITLEQRKARVAEAKQKFLDQIEAQKE